MLNVSKIFDQYGWCFYFIAKEMAKYSRCRFTPQKWDKLDFSLQDIIIISGSNISYQQTAIDIPKECRRRGIKTIGMICGEYDIPYEGVDLIVAISPQIYLYAKDKYKNTPVIFLPEGIDCDYFQPVELRRNQFIGGWAGGNKGKPFKRAHLFDQLKYPVRLKCDHGHEFFIEGRTQTAMKEFYASIDCFINLSTTEACPRVILEALACGLPVISTDVGAVPLLIPDDYIIPVSSETQTIIDVNNKLDELANSYELREGMGKVNRAWAEQVWAWEHIMPIYDEIFYYLKQGNITKIEEIGQSVIEPFKKYFQPCDKYTRQIANFGKQKIERVKPPEGHNFDYIITIFLNELQRYEGQYWMSRETCLDTVNRQRCVLNRGKIYLGVNTPQNRKNLAEFINKIGGVGTESTLFFKGLEINIGIESVKETKPMVLYGKAVNVPSPVIPYLSEKFGLQWRTK